MDFQFGRLAIVAAIREHRTGNSRRYDTGVTRFVAVRSTRDDQTKRLNGASSPESTNRDEFNRGGAAAPRM